MKLFGVEEKISLEKIKELGKYKTKENLENLLKLYNDSSLNVELKREVVSSIGRSKNNDFIYKFIKDNVFKKNYMDIVYQMYRTLLYKSKIEKRFDNLKNQVKEFYDNEMINKMTLFYDRKQNKKQANIKNESNFSSPTILFGDSKETLRKISPKSIQFVFTSPPYYNAREYSDYTSYQNYLEKMKNILIECNRILEDGRFIIINVSPVITKRPGREFESIRYPIHFDFHRILTEAGFYFVDEIIWIKPQETVKNRNGGYQQTKRALSYKPNCITESLLVYRKNSYFLLDKNIRQYVNKENIKENENEKIEKTNCWYINPKSDRNHPAVFPEELCRKVLTYYSFKGDFVLDPFAGSGTFGRVAKEMGRIPILSELNKEYLKIGI